MTRDLLGHGFRIRKSSEITTEKGSCCLPRVWFASLAADGWMRRVPDIVKKCNVGSPPFTDYKIREISLSWVVVIGREIQREV